MNKNILKLITTDAGPSWSTIAKIHLVNRLNALNIPINLYGDSQWPKKHCPHYYTIAELNLSRNDIVLNDGFTISSLFDAVNLERYRYSAGRKKRALQWIQFIFRYFMMAPKLRHLKIIEFPAKDKALSLSPLILESLQEPVVVDDKVFIRRDIDDSFQVLNEIKKYQSSKIVIASAILKPTVFREHVAPQLGEKLTYIGFQEPNHVAPSETDSAARCISSWVGYVSTL